MYIIWIWFYYFWCEICWYLESFSLYWNFLFVIIEYSLGDTWRSCKYFKITHSPTNLDSINKNKLWSFHFLYSFYIEYMEIYCKVLFLLLLLIYCLLIDWLTCSYHFGTMEFYISLWLVIHHFFFFPEIVSHLAFQSFFMLVSMTF